MVWESSCAFPTLGTEGLSHWERSLRGRGAAAGRSGRRWYPAGGGVEVGAKPQDDRGYLCTLATAPGDMQTCAPPSQVGRLLSSPRECAALVTWGPQGGEARGQGTPSLLPGVCLKPGGDPAAPGTGLGHGHSPPACVCGPAGWAAGAGTARAWRGLATQDRARPPPLPGEQSWSLRSLCCLSVSEALIASAWSPGVVTAIRPPAGGQPWGTSGLSLLPEACVQ